jgi:hypothetical protein
MNLPKVAKAVTGAVVTCAAYLVGVVPAEGGFGDVSLQQWIAGIVFVGGAYGLVYTVPPAGRGTRIDQIPNTSEVH